MVKGCRSDRLARVSWGLMLVLEAEVQESAGVRGSGVRGQEVTVASGMVNVFPLTDDVLVFQRVASEGAASMEASGPGQRQRPAPPLSQLQPHRVWRSWRGPGGGGRRGSKKAREGGG